jgi:hypothetical protein
MTLQLLHSEVPYISGKFVFLFYQCTKKPDHPKETTQEGSTRGTLPEKVWNEGRRDFWIVFYNTFLFYDLICPPHFTPITVS